MSAKKIEKGVYIKGKRKINRHPLELIIIKKFLKKLIIINSHIFGLINFSDFSKKLIIIRFKSNIIIYSYGA